MKAPAEKLEIVGDDYESAGNDERRKAERDNDDPHHPDANSTNQPTDREAKKRAIR